MYSSINSRLVTQATRYIQSTVGISLRRRDNSRLLDVVALFRVDRLDALKKRCSYLKLSTSQKEIKSSFLWQISIVANRLDARFVCVCVCVYFYFLASVWYSPTSTLLHALLSVVFLFIFLLRLFSHFVVRPCAARIDRTAPPSSTASPAMMGRGLEGRKTNKSIDLIRRTEKKEGVVLRSPSFYSVHLQQSHRHHHFLLPLGVFRLFLFLSIASSSVLIYTEMGTYW